MVYDNKTTNLFELLQTYLEIMTNFFERLMQVAEYHGIKSVKKLSEHFEYRSPEKLYRLERDKNNSPSYQILCDIANKFDDVDMNWLVTGNGQSHKKKTEKDQVNDPTETYKRLTFEEILAEKVVDKLEPTLNLIRKNVEYNLIELKNQKRESGELLQTLLKLNTQTALQIDDLKPAKKSKS